ncbi:hypothetical protein CEXT_137731 [Caerostris extrusa]|uniref:Uncharacterized protein n=1 Tax=Caerostris extrusa TaxID=172846 RepID=A0AAV4SA92_CAEEX|nr:hypothetical protein CEXT_137731 [Caerostris extrusa]
MSLVGRCCSHEAEGVLRQRKMTTAEMFMTYPFDVRIRQGKDVTCWEMLIPTKKKQIRQGRDVTCWEMLIPTKKEVAEEDDDGRNVHPINLMLESGKAEMSLVGRC